MDIKRFSVSEFKARCTVLLRELERAPRRLEITKRGRVIAVVSPPPEPEGEDPARWLGSLRGTVLQYEAPVVPATPATAWDISKD
jgi:hypothetical protein